MKTRSLVAVIVVALFLLAAHPAAYADPFTFETLPASGDVAGPAGSTVGWGYTITNLSLQDWLVMTAINAGPFLNGTPNAIFDFPILAPGTTVSVAFDLAHHFGLYELAWDATAPVGFVNAGDFIVSAEWWSGDPFIDGSFQALADDQSAAYTATVTGPTTAVPLPSTLLLLITGGMTALFVKRTDRRSV